MINKIIFFSALLALFNISFTEKASADTDIKPRHGIQNSFRNDRRFLLNTGLSIVDGFPCLNINYNIVEQFSIGLGLGYSSNNSSKNGQPVSAGDYRIIGIGKFFLYDVTPNVGFYTETNAGLVTGTKVIDPGGFLNNTPLSTAQHTDFVAAQKLGLEIRTEFGLTVNAAWGVYYETFDTTDALLLGGLFKNTFVPLAIDLLVGYSF